MAVESGAVLAGVGGTSLCWVAPVGTTAPADATTELGTGWIDLGWVAQDGLELAVDEDTNDVFGYGSQQKIRTLITSSSQSVAVAFLETNPTVLEVYHRLTLGSLPAPDATGAFQFSTGAATTARYAFVFDMVDGLNHKRAHMAEVEVTAREGMTIQSGEVIQYGVTLSPVPGADGNSVDWFYVVDALKSA